MLDGTRETNGGKREKAFPGEKITLLPKRAPVSLAGRERMRMIRPVNPARRSLGARCAAELPTKVAVWLGLTVGICVPYFTLQRLRLFPPRSLPSSALDAVAFHPEWVFAYHSIALLVPLAPLMASRRSELLRYAKGLALLCVACFAVFLFFPVAGPRPETVPSLGAYRFLVALDRPGNSFPSLHAGLTLYSFLFAWKVLSGSLSGRGRAAFLVAASAWGGAILVATLFTKQHWAIDLPPGLLLAWAAHSWAWRDSEAPAILSPPTDASPED